MVGVKEDRKEVLAQGAHPSFGAASPYDGARALNRLLIHFRLSVAMNVGLLLLCIVLGNALAEIFPLKEIRYALLRIDPADNRIYRIQPLDRDVDGFDIAMELLAKRYVKNRLDIDSTTQALRMREVQRTSEQSEWQEFKDQFIDNDAIQKIINQGVRRAIEIKTAQLLRYFPGDRVWAWAVDFIRHDYANGDAEPYESVELTAYLNLTTDAQTVTEAERDDNPLGIRVLDMTVKNPRIISNDPEQDYLK